MGCTGWVRRIAVGFTACLLAACADPAMHGSVSAPLTAPLLERLAPVDAHVFDSLPRAAHTDGTRIIVASGDAYVYEKDGSAWVEVARLNPDLAAVINAVSVAIDGDLAVVGYTGLAVIFGRDAGGWTPLVTLDPADSPGSERFGIDVDVSGDRVVVGTQYGEKAYVYERNLGGADAWGRVSLSAMDDYGGSYLGSAVAISGDVVLLGAREDRPGDLISAGSAYLFGRDVGGDGHWGVIQKLVASDVARSDGFGHDVALYGTTAIVSADLGGAAYFFERDLGGANAWGEQRRVSAPVYARVDLMADVAIVGSEYDPAGPALSGQSYVHQRDAGGTEAWGRVATLSASDAIRDDRFGNNVTIGGGVAMVSGYIFERDLGGSGNWGELALLECSGASFFDHFGRAVAIDNDLIAVGARGDAVRGVNASAGSVSIFARDASNPFVHQQVQKLATPDITAQRYGHRVSLSGETLVVVPDERIVEGAVFVHERNLGGSDNWGHSRTVSVSGVVDFETASISGDILVAGSPYADEPTDDEGAAYVFYRDQGGAESWGQVAKLVASDRQINDYFGYEVAAEGETAVVCSYGGCYVFQRSAGGAEAWGQVAKLDAGAGIGRPTIDGDTIVIGGPNLAKVFYRDMGGSSGWGSVTTLTVPGSRYFGASVAVRGDNLVVGDTPSVVLGGPAGSRAFLFARNEGGPDGWGLVQELAVDGGNPEYLGLASAISDDRILLGAYGDHTDGNHSGAAYVFALDYVDDCASAPCLNGGTCVDEPGGYSCSCVEGFEGVHCATDIDDCASNPCQNGGTCTDAVAAHTCACVEGFEGSDCETNIDDCTPNPCQNSGTCTDAVAAHTCACVEGFEGSDCETNIDDCAPNPCQNGGTCTDGIDSHTCTCADGFAGTDCRDEVGAPDSDSGCGCRTTTGSTPDLVLTLMVLGFLLRRRSRFRPFGSLRVRLPR